MRADVWPSAISCSTWRSRAVIRGAEMSFGELSRSALVTVAALLAVAALLPARPRALLGAAAFGVGTHLFRDAGTGGAPLLWPLTARNVSIPYGVYATALSAAATLARRAR